MPLDTSKPVCISQFPRSTFFGPLPRGSPTEEGIAMKPALKSFLLGVATLFDLAGVLTAAPVRRDPIEVDAQAIRSDWLAVGDDMRVAFAWAADVQGKA